MTQLNGNRLNPAEEKRIIWHCVPEHGTPFEALLAPGYWAHCSAKLAPGARIEVYAEDDSYFAELIVRDAGRRYAKVAVLRHINLDSVEVLEAETANGGYEVKFQGPHLKWCVIRLSDRSRIVEGKTKAEASAEMASLVQTAPVQPPAQAPKVA